MARFSIHPRKRTPQQQIPLSPKDPQHRTPQEAILNNKAPNKHILRPFHQTEQIPERQRKNHHLPRKHFIDIHRISQQNIKRKDGILKVDKSIKQEDRKVL